MNDCVPILLVGRKRQRDACLKAMNMRLPLYLGLFGRQMTNVLGL